MTLLQAILLGAVQGLTEFLPVSSSGHLAIVSALMDVPGDVTFTVVVHLATLLAVLIAFRQDVVRLIRGALGLLLDGFKTRDQFNRRLVVMLVLSTLPLVIGALLEDTVDRFFGRTLYVGLGLLITSFILYAAETTHGDGTKTAQDAPFSDAVRIGLAQLFALLPGVSRSGTTISAGLFCGLRRDFAVRYAFLLSIPAVAGSFVFKLPDMIRAGTLSASPLPYLAGFCSALVCGLLAIRLVRLLMKKDAFVYFAYYCAAVGLLTVAVSMIKG